MREWKSLVRSHLGPLPLDPARESDIVDEMAQHVAESYAEFVAAGLSEAEAVTRALQPLRGSERLAAEIARADRPRPAGAPAPPPAGGSAVGALLKDTRYALRLLRRAPGFSLLVVLTLAIGAGANTSIFSVVNAVLLRPLPYPDPSHLVLIGEAGSAGLSNVGYSTFVDWRARSHGFDEMAVIRPWTPILSVDDEPQRVSGLRVSFNYFHMLGVQPALGRVFRPEDDSLAAWHVVLLSDRLWRTRFNADPRIVGKIVTMSNVPFEIVGVLPASYQPLLSEHFYDRAEIWAPLGYDESLPYACRSCQHLKAVGRVKSGVTIESARADIDGVQAELRRQFPSAYAPGAMALRPLDDELTGSIRPVLTVLSGAVAFVLLIGCANVANLLLARMARRDRELALRSALGASRKRLIAQLLVECTVLSIAGGALGAALATWGVPLLSRLAPTSIPRLDQARVDGRVLLFSLGLSVLTAVLFGLLPALRSTRSNVRGAMRADGRRTAQAPTSLARRLLIAADVALAIVLLAAAGLMIKSVSRLLNVDPGFKPDHVLTMQVSLVGAAYATTDATLAKNSEILSSVRAVPGVRAAATAGQVPLGGNGDQFGFHIEHRVAANESEDPPVERYSVTPEYFSVMQIPLVRGRLIDDSDRSTSESVMLVGEETARRLWPGADPIGQRVRVGSATQGPWRTIVGIVGNVRHQALASPPTMEMYMPQSQFTDSFLTLVLRTDGDPASIAGDARRAIRRVARDVPIDKVVPLSDLVSASAGPRRFVMQLLELFAVVGLLLAAVGVYGVIAYSVAERTREIGIRTALGASRGDVVRLVLGGGLSVVGAGLAAGVLMAIAATRYLQGSLFEVSATDPATLAAAAMTLFAVAVLAHAVPIARAMRVDPAIALRQE